MRSRRRYLLLGLCLMVVGASSARETRVSGREQFSWESATQAMPALATGEDGRLAVNAAGRRFEFGEGKVSVVAADSSWTYRFQGSRGGIRALSISTRPEQREPGSLEYRHGQGIVERYIVQSRGVEQQFVLPGPYAGGDVLLTGSVETDLVPEVISSFEGIAFRSEEDATVLFYGAAKAVDAAGRTARLEERWSDGELTIVVPASFLAAARFPVLVDPFIGSRTSVDIAVDLAQNPAIAAREGSDTFQALAVWSTDFTSPRSIRGRIIGPRGNTIVGPIAVVDEFSGFGDYYTNPRVAWSPGDSVWVVAANGSPDGPNGPFIQVNKVSTSGVKTTGGNLNALNPERDVDVACNNSGQCLVVWAYDSDGDTLIDHIRGTFYTPGTNAFGAGFDFFSGTVVEHRHPRVASNGTDYYVVVQHGTSNVDGFSVTTGGAISNDDPTLTGSVFKNPAVSYNPLLNKYLAVWDDGSAGAYGSILSGATPPVPSGSALGLFSLGQKAELTSEQYMGWGISVVEIGGPEAAISLVRPNLSTAFGTLLDSVGGIPAVAVAHFFRGLTTAVYEDDRGSMTDHDIRAREFRTPAVEYADFNNNGVGSGFVWRPGTNAYFYYNDDLPGGTTASVQFGTTGDVPVRMDYFGQGIPDLAIFRPSSGYWYIDVNRDGVVDVSIQFGAPGDIPVPGDYDGDGRTDVAVFRPSNGTWYIRFSATGVTTAVQFGASGDIPVPADYKGDFKTDIAVWRPSDGTWYVDFNLNGTVDLHAQFGTSGDIPVPGDYGPSSGSNAPDGRADFAVFRPSTGTWYVSRNRDGVVSQATQFGTNGDIPIGGIYDSNPLVNSPFGVFRPSNGTWYLDLDNNGTVDLSSQFGTNGDTPMQQASGQYRH